MDNNYKNQLLRIITKYCDSNKVEIQHEQAWQLAGIIEMISKPKSRAEMRGGEQNG